MDTDRQINAIKELMKILKLSAQDVSNIMGIDRSYLYKILNRNYKVANRESRMYEVYAAIIDHAKSNSTNDPLADHQKAVIRGEFATHAISSSYLAWEDQFKQAFPNEPDDFFVIEENEFEFLAIAQRQLFMFLYKQSKRSELKKFDLANIGHLAYLMHRLGNYFNMYAHSLQKKG